MSRLKSKNKFRKIFYSWPVFILLLAMMSLVASGVWGVSKNERTSREKKDSSEERYDKLEDKSDNLLSEIESLRTEKGRESEIRDKFRVVKKGEQLAIILKSVDDPERKVIEENDENLWEKILNFLRD
jgi:hypothetical protein